MIFKKKVYRYLFPLLATMLSVAGFLMLCEAGVRISVPETMWRHIDFTNDWRFDPEIGWVQKPDYRDTFFSREFGWTVDFHTNSDGLLPFTAERTKKPGVFRIMVFGDSTVVGRHVPEDRRIHVSLQRILREKGISAEVLNAGVQGYSTDQELLHARRLAPLYQPDMILCCVCENDFEANVSRTGNGMSKPLFIIKNREISGILPPGSKELGRKSLISGGIAGIVQHSALYSLLRPRIFVLRSKYQILGGKRLSVGLPNDFYYNTESSQKVPFDVFEVLLTTMARDSESFGARFVFYSHPSLPEVWDPYVKDAERRLGLPPGAIDRFALDRKLREISERNYLNYWSVVPYFIENQTRGPFHLLPRDAHCNPTGYDTTAEVLSNFILGVVGKPS